jgi:hypothetical protein
MTITSRQTIINMADPHGFLKYKRELPKPRKVDVRVRLSRDL